VSAISLHPRFTHHNKLLDLLVGQAQRARQRNLRQVMGVERTDQVIIGRRYRRLRRVAP